MVLVDADMFCRTPETYSLHAQPTTSTKNDLETDPGGYSCPSYEGRDETVADGHYDGAGESPGKVVSQFCHF
jgi:hypothetical protein